MGIDEEIEWFNQLESQLRVLDYIAREIDDLPPSSDQNLREILDSCRQLLISQKTSLDEFLQRASSGKVAPSNCRTSV